MIAHADCTHENCKKHGFTARGDQRYRCRDCGATFVEKTRRMGGMRLDIGRAAMIVECLMEGMGVRSTARITRTSKATILDLLPMLGFRCKEYAEAKIRDVRVRDLQIDEIWSYCRMKEATRQSLGESRENAGDRWCFVGIERNTKLVLAWEMGFRDYETAGTFLRKLANATAKVPFQISTDGLNLYAGIPGYFYRHRVHYGQLIKHYRSTQEETRYSPAQIVSARKERVSGDPDMDRICTSHVERSNLSIRMGLRRLTRLTNAFSKKHENHEAALALYFLHYNFCKRHGTLGTTPAVAAGLADHAWTTEELIRKTSPV